MDVGIGKLEQVFLKIMHFYIRSFIMLCTEYFTLRAFADQVTNVSESSVKSIKNSTLKQGGKEIVIVKILLCYYQQRNVATHFY